MSNLEWGLIGIAFTFFAHYFFVTIVLGLSILIPIFEIWGRLKKNEENVAFARKLTSYLIRVDLFAGVLATWLTVFLAGYWPSLLFTATDTLFYPVSIAIVGIMIAIVSMAIYWYTWDKMKPNTHIVVGLFMMIGALLVPLGMSSIFATIDYPYGVKVETVSGLTLFLPNNQSVFLNPVYWPLVLYTWFISLAVTSFIVTVYAQNVVKKGEFGNGIIRLTRSITIISSVLSLIFMIILVNEIKSYSQYIYTAMQGNYSLMISEILAIIMLVLAIGLFSRNLIYPMALVGSIASYFLMMYFEIEMNISRYPYIIVIGKSGIPASDEINPLFNIPAILPEAAMLTFVIMLITFLATLYIAFIMFPVKRRSKADEIL